MKKKILQIIQFIVLTTLAVFLVYFVFKDIDLSFLWKTITEVNFFWVILSVLVGILAIGIRAARWNLLVEPLGYSPTFYHSFLAVVFGYFANIGFPRIGEIARCSVLSKKESIPFNKLIGTVIIERIIDLIVLIILASLTFMIKINFFGTFIYNNIIKPTSSNFSVTKILLLMSVLLVIIIASIFILKRSNNVVMQKILGFMHGIRDGLQSVKGLKKRKLFITYTFLLWSCYWAMSWLICLAIPQLINLTPVDGLFLMVVGGIGMAVPVQNGIGVFHFIVGQAIAMYGFDFKTTGILYATVTHESQTIFVIFLGIIASILIFVKKKKIHENI